MVAFEINLFLVEVGKVQRYKDLKHKKTRFYTGLKMAKNQVSALYTANKAEYDALYVYIAEIANDGKIMYKGTPKEK